MNLPTLSNLIANKGETEGANMVTLKEITKDSVNSILKLKVAEGQDRFVASNAVSIAQAHFEETAWFRGIYDGDTPVGFIMLDLNHEKAEYWIWRFMVDKDQQGKGYGAQALQQAIDFVKTLPNAKELYLSYVPKEGNPAPFYQKLGFVETGEMEDDEKVMKLVF